MKYCLWISLVVFVLGCAKVSLQTSEPIKVDINMRLDIYQHAVEEIDSIEDQVFGDKMSFRLPALIRDAYALTDVEQAVYSRKARTKKIEQMFANGLVGEDRNALLIILKDGASDSDKKFVKDENADRKLIYKATAEKMNLEYNKIVKLFYDDHFKRAQKGYMFETLVNGKYEWKKK